MLFQEHHCEEPGHCGSDYSGNYLITELLPVTFVMKSFVGMAPKQLFSVHPESYTPSSGLLWPLAAGHFPDLKAV